MSVNAAVPLPITEGQPNVIFAFILPKFSLGCVQGGQNSMFLQGVTNTGEKVAMTELNSKLS